LGFLSKISGGKLGLRSVGIKLIKMKVSVSISYIKSSKIRDIV
jgi:hypothetical protein